jgi:plasmid stabilization system protein ParE
MGSFKIRYHPKALNDLSASFEWVAENWGADAARKWYNELERLIEGRLSRMPGSCPIAPENEEFDLEVRHLIFGRYRVIFAIKDGVGIVLHICGPFVDHISEDIS